MFGAEMFDEHGDNIKFKELEDHPKLAAKILGAFYRLEEFQNEMNDLFQLFIYHDINFQKIMSRSNMLRESVVVSDTDSVIYTVMEWSNWFTGLDNIVSEGSYNISALATYWYTMANADTMAKFSIGLVQLVKVLMSCK